jgi:DivIVA domain-containing protein
VTLLLLLLTLAVFGVTAALIAGAVDGRMPEPASTVPAVSLPEGPVSAGVLGRVRFAPALRGYRMDQVDAVLDRVGEELSARDARINELTEELCAARPDHADPPSEADPVEEPRT